VPQLAPLRESKALSCRGVLDTAVIFMMQAPKHRVGMRLKVRQMVYAAMTR
jgi:hypothetical protein